METKENETPAAAAAAEQMEVEDAEEKAEEEAAEGCEEEQEVDGKGRSKHKLPEYIPAFKAFHSCRRVDDENCDEVLELKKYVDSKPHATFVGLFPDTAHDESPKYVVSHKLDGCNMQYCFFKIEDKKLAALAVAEEKVQSVGDGFFVTLCSRLTFINVCNPGFLDQLIPWFNLGVHLKRAVAVFGEVRRRYEETMGRPLMTMRLYGEVFGYYNKQQHYFGANFHQEYYPFAITVNIENPDAAYVVKLTDCLRICRAAGYSYLPEPVFASCSDDLIRLVRLCQKQCDRIYPIWSDTRSLLQEGFVVAPNITTHWNTYRDSTGPAALKIVSQSYAHLKSAKLYQRVEHATIEHTISEQLQRLQQHPVCKKYLKHFKPDMIENAANKVGYNVPHSTIALIVLHTIVTEIMPEPEKGASRPEAPDGIIAMQKMMLERYFENKKADFFRVKRLLELTSIPWMETLKKGDSYEDESEEPMYQAPLPTPEPTPKDKDAVLEAKESSSSRRALKRKQRKERKQLEQQQQKKNSGKK